MFKFLFIFSVALFSIPALSATNSVPEKRNAFHKPDPIEKKLQKATQEFSIRWHDFGGHKRTFPLWKKEEKEELLKDRFEQFCKERFSLILANPKDCEKKGAAWHFKEPYKLAENFQLWHSRYPYPGSFSYNLAHPLYNASLIVLHEKRFLALEAPTEGNLSTFYQILTDYKVDQLVRLTPAKTEKKECSFPYWEGKATIHEKTGRPALSIEGREINYFAIDSWVDHQAIAPNKLLALVKAVQQSPRGGMIAVHCRAGVGRTGTFIAAYLLIDEIDQQLARGVALDQIEVSIDKVLWELSLQRPFVVNFFPYYLTLHQLIETYVSSLQKN